MGAARTGVGSGLVRMVSTAAIHLDFDRSKDNELFRMIS